MSFHFFFSSTKLFFIASRPLPNTTPNFLICTGSGMVQSFFFLVGYHEHGRGSTIAMKKSEFQHQHLPEFASPYEETITHKEGKEQQIPKKKIK